MILVVGFIMSASTFIFYFVRYNRASTTSFNRLGVVLGKHGKSSWIQSQPYHAVGYLEDPLSDAF